MPPRSHEVVRDTLNSMHDTNGLSWERMGAKLGVPGGTLWDIVDGKPVPRKWKHRLGIHRPRDLYAMPVAELRWAIQNREEM